MLVILSNSIGKFENTYHSKEGKQLKYEIFNR
jgi:hypothetical protein